MNKRKLAGLLFYVAALCFYALAIAAFVNSDSSMVAVWICIGTVMIILGADCKKKSDEE